MPKTDGLSRISRRRQRTWRWFFALGLPVLLVALVEISLRLAGVGFDTAFWVPGSEPGTVRTNDEFARQFSSKKNPSRPFFTQIPARKPAGTVRVFLLGESAAMGTPDPAFGPARMMELMLQKQYPDQRIEIINAAMRGIDSFVIRQIARDCAKYDPDLFVIYTGNNECVGLHAPGEGTPEVVLWRPMALLGDWCKATHLGQWFRLNAAARAKPATQDMDFFRRQSRGVDDPLMEMVRANFQANLRSVCALGKFPKVIATVPVNLRDCPPLASVHRLGLTAAELTQWREAFDKGVEEEQTKRHASAIIHYQTAAALDKQHAELRYRMGRCFLALANPDKARQHFVAACDLDGLRFRADTRLNEALRELAVQFQNQGVTLCDAQAAFAASPLSPHGIPGETLFYEHVHPTFAGTHLLAATLSQAVGTALADRLGQPAAVVLPSETECARALAYTRLDEYNVAQAMARLRGAPPFLDQVDHSLRQARFEKKVETFRLALTHAELDQVRKTYVDAIRQRPDDWVLRFNVGNAFTQMGRPVEALDQFNWLVKTYPNQAAFQKIYGHTLLAIGKKDEARSHLTQALKLAPHDDEIRTLARQTVSQ